MNARLAPARVKSNNSVKGVFVCNEMNKTPNTHNDTNLESNIKNKNCPHTKFMQLLDLLKCHNSARSTGSFTASPCSFTASAPLK